MGPLFCHGGAVCVCLAGRFSSACSYDVTIQQNSSDTLRPRGSSNLYCGLMKCQWLRVLRFSLSYSAPLSFVFLSSPILLYCPSTFHIPFCLIPYFSLFLPSFSIYFCISSTSSHLSYSTPVSSHCFLKVLFLSFLSFCLLVLLSSLTVFIILILLLPRISHVSQLVLFIPLLPPPLSSFCFLPLTHSLPQISPQTS